MALDAFSGMMTASQIVHTACSRVGSPQLYLDEDGNETLDALGYLELQMLLDHLAITWDWPFAKVALSFNVSTRETILPSTFWRISIDDPIWLIDCEGGRSRLHFPDEGVFWDQVGTNTGSSDRPSRGFIQKSSQTLFVDPIPDAVYVAELHFMPWQVPLDTINAKPWFPWSSYLVSALAVKLNLTQDDGRADKEAALALSLMKEIRHSISTQGERTHQIKLNPSIYRTPKRF